MTARSITDSILNCEIAVSLAFLFRPLHAWAKTTGRRVYRLLNLFQLYNQSPLPLTQPKSLSSRTVNRTHSPSFQSLHLLHSSFSFPKLSVTSPTSQLILQPFPRLYLRHNSFSKPSVASPMSQLILQPFFHFSYVTGFHLRHLVSRPSSNSQASKVLFYIIQPPVSTLSWFSS